MQRASETKIRGEIVTFCRLLSVRNLLAAADGNVSYRISESRILITPSGKNKAFITSKDIAVIALDGKIIRGEPSSERFMHLEIYKSRPDAKAIVHAHPPTAIAWSIARPELAELPFESMPEVILALGSVPIVQYVRPGTAEMGEALQPFLTSESPRKVMVLGRHGAVSWGSSLLEAYNGMERVEHSSQILKAAHELGGLSKLQPAELADLRRIRAEKGNTSL